MQPSINTTIRKNDVYSYGIREAFFSTFSSKKATGTILAFACRQRFSSVSASCSFTGKELDSETGYGYHGARYMDYELMTCWLSVDPMADKYPNISPYAYCAWNPIRMIDPSGDTIVLTGDDASKKEALRQIQQKSHNMIFYLDDDNRLIYTGKAKTKTEKYMKEIIEKKNVMVDLCVQDNSRYNDISIRDVGGFFGNFLSEDGVSVTCSNIINVEKSAKEDKLCGNLGNMIWHEIAEAYEGGLISLGTRTDAEMKIVGQNNPIYNDAHYNAGKYFPGTISISIVSYPREIRPAIATMKFFWGIDVGETYNKHQYTR